MSAICKSILLVASLSVTITCAGAKDLSDLKKGIYLPTDVGCRGAGGAATMSFDGTNLSGHHQVCKTIKLDRRNSYRSICIEAQGADWPSISKIDESKDKEQFDFEARVLSSHSFIYDKQAYVYCGR